MNKNKNIGLLTLVSLALVASCSRVDNPGPTSREESSGTKPAEINTKEAVVATLKELAKSNYTLSYTYEGVDYLDEVTPDYVSLNDQSGYILLPSYLDGSKKLAYGYTSASGSIHLQTSLSSEETGVPYSDLSSFDGLTLLKEATDESFATLTMEEGENVFTSKDNALTRPFAKLMGMENDWFSGAIAAVSFASERAGELSFFLSGVDENGQLVDYRYGQGILSSIGATKNEVLESYIGSFAYPEEVISASETSALLGSSLSSIASLKMIRLSDGSVLSERHSRADYDAGQLNAVISDGTGADEYVYVHDVSGNATRLTFDPVDRLEKETSLSKTWRELGWVKDSFQAEAFRKDSGNVYTYFGSDGNDLLYSLSQIAFQPAIDALTAEVVDGRVASLKAVSGNLITTEGVPVRQEMEIQIAPTPMTIQRPTAPDESDENVVAAFDALTRTGASYRGVTTNDIYQAGNSLTTYVNSKVVYFEENIVSALGNSKDQQGYYQGKDGWTKFKIENGVAKAVNSPSLTLDLKQMTGFKVSPRALKLDADQKTLRPAPYLAPLTPAVFPSMASADEILSSSYRMNLENQKITSISYGVQSSGYVGTETMAIEYPQAGKEIEAPADVMKLLSEMSPDFQEPTSWKEESPEVYDALLDFYQDPAVADSVPYLYFPELSGRWTGFGAGSSVMVYTEGGTLDPKVFYAQYVEHLKKEGYQIQQDEYGGDVYAKGEIAVKLSPETTSQDVHITFKKPVFQG